MKARIYKPAKSAMQSGRGGLDQWVVVYEASSSKQPEPLMGWTASGDTLEQVRMTFPTLEQAKAFAETKGLEFTVSTGAQRRVKPRNFSDNFRYIPLQDTEKS
ncbi:MAG: ETC complex I subunit [Alphaproteobacteria bacterium]|nr:ETC complex I subunit [Alphaproteobacteria bacterium]